MTTPDPVRLHRAFRQFADQGLAACAIEASSIGLAEHRLAGTQIRVGVFTNFTQDHLDYHGSMADYWLAKRALFDWPGLRTAVVNIDDPHGAQLHAELLQRSGASALDVWSVSAAGEARIAARDIAAGTQGLQWLVVEGAEQHLLQSRVVGHYNVLNLLGVVATLRSLGCRWRMPCTPAHSSALCRAAWSNWRCPASPGGRGLRPHARCSGKSPANIAPLAQQRGGQLWCVFGCGGS